MATTMEHLTAHTARRVAKLDAIHYPRKNHTTPPPATHDHSACCVCQQDIWEPVYWRRQPDQTITPICTRCATS